MVDFVLVFAAVFAADVVTDFVADLVTDFPFFDCVSNLERPLLLVYVKPSLNI